MADLEKTEIAAVEVANRDTATAIDALYEVMEREIEAKKYVVTNQKLLTIIFLIPKNNND